MITKTGNKFVIQESDKNRSKRELNTRKQARKDNPIKSPTLSDIYALLLDIEQEMNEK
jgi:hypothetical protein